MDIMDIIESAKALGIKITNAELGSELCTCWCDRVRLAQSLFDRCDFVACQAAIDDATRYAV